MALNPIKLSFILPFYGVERYIGQCLESIYSQDIPEEQYEVICVNDCSPDNSEQIVLQFADNHPNLKLIRHERNMKLGAARNTGMVLAQGKYVWFVDTDDYIRENCLKELLAFCEQNELEILHWAIQDNQGQWIRKVSDSGVMSGIEDLTKGSQDMTFPWNRIYLRDFLVNKNLVFNDLWGGDVIHTILALNAAQRVMNRQECYYYYRTDNMNSDMRSPDTAHKVISFCFVLAKALEDCRHQVSIVLSSLLNEIVEWRVNQSFKPVLRMPIKEKRKFYQTMHEDCVLRDFVLGVANDKVCFIVQYPMVVYLVHPLYRFLRNIRSIVSHH